jgi:Fic-DOC domain mobile mystery protein B
VAGFESIPGETPITDISGLKVRGIATRRELAVYEADNIRRALVKYLAGKPTGKTAPFNYSWSLRLHKQMFGRVWKWAGNVRTCDLNLGVPWQQVEPQLFNLLKDLAYWEQAGMDLLEQAVLLHHKAVSIHPFLNGNGRWSRLLANIWLRLHGVPITEWPEPEVGAVSPIREDYLKAIQQADGGEYALLTELHRRFTPST